MPSRRRGPAAAKRFRPGSRSHSVVLLHGVLGQGFVYWNLVKRYLSSDNYHFHEIRMPFFGFGDLRKAARHLGKEIDVILKECADEAYEDRVDLIAHSAGGLVARHYVKFLGGDKKVHSLVTLGTPHLGTYTSALFPLNTVARQTLPGSAFLRELNAGPDTKEKIHYTSVYSRTDGVVVPATNAILPGARNVEIKFLTHWGFLWDREVYKAIRDAVDHAPDAYDFYTGPRPKKRPGARSRPAARPAKGSPRRVTGSPSRRRGSP